LFIISTLQVLAELLLLSLTALSVPCLNLFQVSPVLAVESEVSLIAHVDVFVVCHLHLFDRSFLPAGHGFQFLNIPLVSLFELVIHILEFPNTSISFRLPLIVDGCQSCSVDVALLVEGKLDLLFALLMFLL
jgi:hypothetical protein